MNMYKKSQFLYTERMAKRSDISRAKINDYLEETTEGKLYLIFEPFLYTLKDIKDTFKPYKTRKQVARDFLQIFAGIGNAVTGLMMLLVVPFMIVIGFTDSISKPRTLLPSLFKALVSTPAEAVIILLRASFQIATAPFILLRAPLRGLISLYKGPQKIEDNIGIKALVREAVMMEQNDSYVNSTALINYNIRLKCMKARIRGQDSKISELNAALAKHDVNEIQINYKMFLTNPKNPAQETNPSAFITAPDVSTTIYDGEVDTSLTVNNEATTPSPTR